MAYTAALPMGEALGPTTLVPTSAEELISAGLVFLDQDHAAS